MASIVKRGERWQAKIRRDGYPPLSRTFSTKSEAQAWARAQEAEMERGTWRDARPAESITLYKLLEHYLREVVPTKRGAEIEALRIKTLQNSSIARYSVAALTPIVLAEYRDMRLAAGCQGSTVNRELNIISAVINYARKELMFAIQNPVEAIRRPKNPPPRDRRLSEDEEQRLMRALSDHSAHEERKDSKRYRVGARNVFIKPIVELALETAMRRSEILNLKWQHVDLQKRVAKLIETKNGESRSVPLSTKAVKILENLPRSIDGRVFPVSADALKKAFERACTRAQLEDFHFHDLRHEATTRLSEHFSVLELAAITGHKDLKMLKRYYHPRAETLAKKLEKIG